MNIDQLCKKYFPILLIVFTFSFAVVNFTIPEYGVYSSMTESILEDGDLNIADELFYPEQKFLLTESKNYPHHHSSGAVAGWIPFALYSKVVSNLSGLTDEELQYEDHLKGFKKPFNFRRDGSKFFWHMSLVFGNILLTAFGIFLLFKNKSIFKSQNSYRDFCIFILSTPLIYYMTLEPGASNNMSLIFTALLLTYIEKDLTKKDLVLIGLIWGLSFSVRIGNFFYFPIILYILRNNLKLKSLSIAAISTLVGILPHFINEKIRFGEMVVGYSNIFYFNPILIWETMFSPYKGIFIFSPILFVAILVGLFEVIREKKFTLKLAIILSIGLKVFFFGSTYSHGGGVFGARQFIQDLPFFFILFSSLGNTKIRNYLLLIGFTVSTYIYIFYINQGLFLPHDMLFSNYFSLWSSSINNNIEYSAYPLLKLVNFSIPLIILVFLGRKIKNDLFVIFFAVSLYSITFINFKNNDLNTKKLTKSGYYKNTFTANTLDMALAYENIGSMQERFLFLHHRHREKEAKEALRVRKDYVKSIIQNSSLKNEQDLLRYIPELSSERHHGEFLKVSKRYEY